MRRTFYMLDQKNLNLVLKPLGITFAAYLICYFMLDKLIATCVFNYIPTDLKPFWQLISLPVNPKAWMIISLIALIYIHWFHGNEKKVGTLQSKTVNFIATALLSSGVICESLKILLGRSRPELWLQQNIYGLHLLSLNDVFHSTPSGHATIAFVLATAIGLIRPQWRWFVLALATVIAFSRVLLNQHFLSDIILGAYVGWIITYLIANYQRSHPL